MTNRDSWLNNNEYKDYAEYLSSNLWKWIKLRHFKNKKNWICKTCSSVEDLQVHHVSYNDEVMSGKNIKSLKTLCRKCHYLYET